MKMQLLMWRWPIQESAGRVDTDGRELLRCSSYTGLQCQIQEQCFRSGNIVDRPLLIEGRSCNIQIT